MGWWHTAYNYLAGYFGNGGAMLVVVFAACVVLAGVVTILSILF